MTALICTNEAVVWYIVSRGALGKKTYHLGPNIKYVGTDPVVYVLYTVFS